MLCKQKIWEVIKQNKDLDLPAHKVMVATVRCEEIANEKYMLLANNKSWLELEKVIQAGPISGLGEKLTSLLESSLSEYDSEAVFFDESVRDSKRKDLELKSLQEEKRREKVISEMKRSDAAQVWQVDRGTHEFWYKGKDKTPDERRVAICIFDDVAEECREAAHKYYNHYLPFLLEACNDKSTDVRQAAVYGVGVCAEFGGSAFSSHVGEALSRLDVVIGHPNKLDPDNIMAFDNAVSALGKICRFHRD